MQKSGKRHITTTKRGNSNFTVYPARNPHILTLHIVKRKEVCMCTAITYKTKSHYFGRNLELEYSYSESVTITPRNYPFTFRKTGDMNSHYAMIGMAYVVNDYPLYYDATNEKGVSMAGLNFPDNAHYKTEISGKDNIAPFELIPWILGQCANLKEVKILLKNVNIVQIDYSDELPLSPLHWMISDRNGSIVVESMKEGLRIYDNPAEVLTNNPPFDYHMTNLSNYMSLTNDKPGNYFSDKIELESYSRGMGTLGLPGDWSSASRFVRAAFVRCNSVSGESEKESVSQFFHILDSVKMPRGAVKMGENLYEITIYSSCCNTDKGIYYYKTYEDRCIKKVSMQGENLDGNRLVIYKI